ncbi:MAG: PEGA domain-containing protein [Deltaproteobacteria bacterium]|nr:PEGA domain-containing protein [Deltaproteobacteria bacterium]
MTRWPAFALGLLALLLTGIVQGDDEAEDPVAEARRFYQEGIAHVRASEWAEAHDAFVKSGELRPHAVTTYNLGACQRAMGRYTRARASFRSAITRGAQDEGELPASLAAESKRFLGEIQGLLVHVELTVVPKDASIAVDGAPLQADPSQGQLPIFVAGVLPGGPGKPLPAETFELVLDPGPHVFLLTRKGYDPVVVNRSYKAGAKVELDLELDRLPALLHVSASGKSAVVEIDGQTVGLAPIDITRPAGTYKVVVRQDGYTPYETLVRVKPGEAVKLRATLVEEEDSVFESWWFWTAAGAVVTGAVVTTYFLTRPDPERPALNGGGLGWTVPLE